MCPQNIGIKDHSLGNTDEGTNNCFDGEGSDIHALESGTNDDVTYASIDSNNLTYHRYKNNFT